MMRIFKRLFIFILCLSLVLPNISLSVYASEIVNNVETQVPEIESDHKDILSLTSVSDNEISEEQTLPKEETDESDDVKLDDKLKSENLDFDVNQNQYKELNSTTVNFSSNLFFEDSESVSDASINYNRDFTMSEDTKNMLSKDIYAALSSCTEKLDITKYKITYQELSDFFLDFLYKNPQFFHIDGFGASHPNGYVTEFRPSYSMDKDTYLTKISEMYTVVNSITQNVSLEWSDVEKVLYINDYLALNVEYDRESYIHGSCDANAYDALVGGKTVCYGYALAFQLLAHELGIPSQIIGSTSLNHAWNLVLVDGNYYHVDVTWNDPSQASEGYAGHDYLLKSTAYMQNDHLIKNDWMIEGDWEISYADDTKYDSYFWNTVGNPFYHVNGYWYNVTGINQISKYRYEGNDFKEKGTFAGSANSIITWVGIFENLFYFSTTEGIYSHNPTNDEIQLVFQLSSEDIATDGYISFIKLEPNGELYIYQKKNIYDSTEKAKIKLVKTLTKSTSVYKIIFSGNGSTLGNMPDLPDREYGKTYRLPNNQYLRARYIFNGWNTKADGTGVAYSDCNIFKDLAPTNTNTITLYAQWIEDSYYAPYTITYVLNGGENDAANPSFYCIDSDLITFLNATRTGYRFGGWYFDSALLNKVYGLATGNSGDLTLYAKWNANNYYINCNENGALYSGLHQYKYTYDRTSYIPNNYFVRPGYVFNGWNTKPDGSGISYKVNEEIINLSSVDLDIIILYAQWIAEGEKPQPQIIDMYEEMSLAVGESKSLNAKSSVAGYDISYIDYNSDVISVDQDGMVTAKKAGIAWVSATVGNSNQDCYIVVRDFVATPKELQLNRGETVELLLEEVIINTQGMEDTETITETITWKIEDEMVAEIQDQKNGKLQITGIGGGTTYVTASIGTNQDKAHNQVTVKIPVSVSASMPIDKVFLNSTDLILNQGEEKTLKLTILPYDTTSHYQVEWTLSDPDKLEVIKDVSKPGELKIMAKKGGAVDVTARVIIEEEGKKREEILTCKVIVHSSEGIPQPAPIEVLTNKTDTLSKVELPKGFFWKETVAGETENIKLTADNNLQTYIARYENEAEYIYGEKEVKLAVGTLTGIKAEGDLLLHVEDENATNEVLGEITIHPLYKGILPQNGYDYMKPVVESQYSSAVTITKKADTQNVYEIRTTNPEAIFGKKIKVTFTLKVDGANVTDKKQKGKGWFETTTNLSVAAKGKTVAKNISIQINQKEVEKLTLNLSSPERELQLETKVTDRWNTDISDSTALQFKSSNPKVAKIDKDGKVTILGEGNTILSVLAKDGSNCSKEVELEVRDYKPALEENSILVNAAGTEGTPIHLYNVYDQKEVKVKGISIYDSQTKEYQDGSHLFDIRKTEDENIYTVHAKGTAIPAKNKKATYSIVINTETIGSQDETTEYRDANGLALKITVSNAMPKVTVKQSGKINLFDKNATAILNLTSKDASISKVEWKDKTTDFILSDYQDGCVIISQSSTIDNYQETNGRVNANKVKKDGVLLVTFAGFKVPVETKVKVAVEYKKPSYKLSKGTIGIHPEWNLYEGSDILIDSKTKDAVDISQVAFDSVKDYSIKGDKDGKVSVKQNADANNSASKITLTMRSENWRGAVAVSCNVKNTKPTASLSQNKLVLNTNALTENSEPQKVSCGLSSVDGVSITSLRIQPADAKTKDAVQARTLLVNGNGNMIAVAAQKVIQTGRDQILANGNYKFTIIPTIAIGTENETKDISGITLTIQVVNKAPTITLKGKNSINLLNREDVSGTTYTAKITNTTAAIEKVELTGADAFRFEKPYLENDRIVFKAKETSYFALKRTYVVVPKYTLSDGTIVNGSAMKLKAMHSSLKLELNPKTVVLNISASGDKNGKLIDILVNSKDNYLNGNQRIESITLEHKNFEYEDGKVYIKNPSGLTANKTINLTFKVKLKGQAENSTPYKVTVKVNVKR